MSLDQNLDLFFGRSSDAATQVYARAKRPNAQNAKLIGTITGPFCYETRTLPTSVSFQDLGSGPTLLARAVVPDLCPWSPEQPHLYRIRIELVADGNVIDGVEREWGAHRFAVRNGDFLWNATRVVLRGIRRRTADQTLDQWQIEGSPVMLIRNPDELTCHQASQRGVPLAAVTSNEDGQVAQRLKWLARWPAVLITAVEGDLPHDFSAHEQIPNLILAALVKQIDRIPRWAQVVFCDDHQILRMADHTITNLPIIATRSIDSVSDISALRSECDRLQRDLAGIGQFAGYFIL